jgi:hypothetical protein
MKEKKLFNLLEKIKLGEISLKKAKTLWR